MGHSGKIRAGMTITRHGGIVTELYDAMHEGPSRQLLFRRTNTHRNLALIHEDIDDENRLR